jgi:hypothetical protein
LAFRQVHLHSSFHAPANDLVTANGKSLMD